MKIPWKVKTSAVFFSWSCESS